MERSGSSRVQRNKLACFTGKLQGAWCVWSVWCQGSDKRGRRSHIVQAGGSAMEFNGCRELGRVGWVVGGSETAVVLTM